MNYQSRLTEFENRVYQEAKAVPVWVNETIQERPAAVVLGVFAAGLIAGVGIVVLSVASTSTCSQQSRLTGRWRKAYDTAEAAVPDGLKTYLASIWSS